MPDTGGGHRRASDYPSRPDLGNEMAAAAHGTGTPGAGSRERHRDRRPGTSDRDGGAEGTWLPAGTGTSAGPGRSGVAGRGERTGRSRPRLWRGRVVFPRRRVPVPGRIRGSLTGVVVGAGRRRAHGPRGGARARVVGTHGQGRGGVRP